MEIMSVFSAFSELPGQSFPGKELLVKIDAYQKPLYQRGYVLDDVLLVAMLTTCFHYTQLRSAFIKVTIHLAHKQVYPYVIVKLFVQNFSNIFISSAPTSSKQLSRFKIPIVRLRVPVHILLNGRLGLLQRLLPLTVVVIIVPTINTYIT